MEVFEKLKTALITTPVLGLQDLSFPFILEVDYLCQGLRAILSQIQDGKIIVLLMLAISCDHQSVTQTAV